MPRAKPQVLYALRGTSLEEARANVQPNINRLLAAANCGRHQPRVETFRFEIDAHRVLLTYSRSGKMVVPFGWADWACTALINIDAKVRGSGAYHLRQCRFCSDWMLVARADRVIRNRRLCKTRYVRERKRISNDTLDRSVSRRPPRATRRRIAGPYFRCTVTCPGGEAVSASASMSVTRLIVGAGRRREQRPQSTSTTTSALHREPGPSRGFLRQTNRRKTLRHIDSCN